MEKVMLGKTGLMVTRTAMGCLPIQRVDFDTARDILLRAGYAKERVDALMERAKAQGNG